jgi:hypothetical protein
MLQFQFRVSLCNLPPPVPAVKPTAFLHFYTGKASKLIAFVLVKQVN